VENAAFEIGGGVINYFERVKLLRPPALALVMSTQSIDCFSGLPVEFFAK
jgi:hypothetical protein